MDSNQHPLQNHLIATNLVKYLKFKELKNFRLVCKLWNLSSKQYFQQSSCIVFQSEDGRTRIRKFIESNMDVFVNFKLVNLNISRKYKRIIQIFEENYGHLVKEIALIKCFANYGEVLNGLQNLAVLSIAFPSAYNEELELENNNFEGGEETKIGKNLNLRYLEVTGSLNEDEDRLTPWRGFIEAFPNIEVLGSQCRTSEDLTQLLSILSAYPSALKKLSDFSCVLTDLHNSHIEMVLKLDCKLVNLDVSLAENVDNNLVSSLLKQHSKTLTSVKLFRDSERHCEILDHHFTDVSLSRLTSLEIQCNVINSLAFLKLTQNLKHLNLIQYGDGDVTFNNVLIRKTDPKLVFPSLRSFSYEYFLAPDCMEKVAIIFPNIIRLSTYLNDDNIRVIFRDMQHLEEITVLGTQLSDEGITGVPLNLLERKYRFMKDYRKIPYIGDLKKLWRFVLYPQPQERITDYSVTYGFIDVVNLTCLEIPETSITNSGIEMLQLKRNLITLTTPFYVRNGDVFSRPGSLQTLF